MNALLHDRVMKQSMMIVRPLVLGDRPGQDSMKEYNNGRSHVHYRLFRPSLYYYVEKQLFNRAYWYIVTRGLV